VILLIALWKTAVIKTFASKKRFIIINFQMRSPKAYIGTSGWKYHHWENKFYPSDLNKKDQLKYFTKTFETVELNNSFYRQPTLKNFIAWAEQVPDNFIYAVKANRYFTHLKKLKITKDEIMVFLDAANGLGEKLGPILFQLPPRWKVNIERLEAFLKILPHGYRYTFEFRDQSWYVDTVFELLKKYNCAFCIYQLAGHHSPIIATADFVYVRLHGPGDKYQGSYDTKSIKSWAGLCRTWAAGGRDVYVYFDNDREAFAAFNALALKKLSKH
jgi:uncharacterized protein YecE (DUF72 family)